MRIALSCCGEGFGHASRLVTLYQELHTRHTITVFCPSTVSAYIREKLPGARIFYTPRFSFAKKGARVKYLATLKKNFATLARMPWIIYRLAGRLDDLDIEAVVTDFDPFTSLAAKAGGIPVLEFNHPGVIRYHFSLRPSALASKAVVRFMESRYDRKINCSFYGSTHGPLIRDEIARITPKNEDFFLVYLNGMPRETVEDILRPFEGIEFRIFPDPDRDFVRDLGNCRGVITTAGHQLSSEAIFLGKPLYVIPHRGQYEQRLNAVMIEKAGWGLSGTLDSLEKTLPEFFRNIDSFPRPVKDHRTGFILTNDKDNIIQSIELFFSESRGFRRQPVREARIPARIPLLYGLRR